MTPKEKAIELYEFYLFYTTKDDCSLYLNHSTGKEFANKCINEIINSNPHSNPFNTSVYSTMAYWIEVKRELEQF